MTLLAPASTWIGSPFHSPRDGVVPEAVVLHIMDGSLAGCDSWFNDQRAQVSAHYGIGKNGEIHQYVALTEAAWANGRIEAGYTAALVDENGGSLINPNRWCVSIEHEGFYPEEPTPAQFEASAQLAAWLFEETLIPGGATGVAVDRKHILRHSDISPLSRGNCPGWSEVTLARYIARVQAILSPPQPAPAPPDLATVRAHLTAIRDKVDAALTALGG